MAVALLFAPMAWADPGPPPIFQKIGVVENLNERIPTQLTFMDSSGEQVRLADWFRGDKPVLMTLVYYRCPMLCNLVLSGLVRSLKGSGLSLGKDYRALTVSIDPTEDAALAAEKKRGYLQSLGVPTTSKDWGFLTGTQENIKSLANAVGFRYAYDEQLKQYAHSAVAFVLTPDGKLSRYVYGVDHSPKDIRLSLVEAGQGRVGTAFDRVLLTCYKYDPATRRYGFFVSAFMKTGALLVFFALAAILAVLWRREIKRGTVA